MDVGEIKFNPNRKTEAAAKDMATGARLMMLGMALFAFALVLRFVVGSAGVAPMVAGLVAVAGTMVSAYGAYLAVTALGWGAAITWVIVASVFVPYLKLAAVLALIVLSVRGVQDAGYKFSVSGPLRKTKQAAQA